MNPTVFIGKITKSHGLKGEVFFALNDASVQLKEKISYLLLAKKNAPPVPYFIESLLPRPNGFLVKFENIHSPADTKPLINNDVFADEKFLEKKSQLNDLEKLTGFEVRDKNFGVVGKIKMTLELPGQIVFAVEHASGSEVLLPANEKMIVEINEKEKVILYEAPDGLIELYLS